MCDTTSSRPTPDVTTYTTAELERLCDLRVPNVKPMEYVRTAMGSCILRTTTTYQTRETSNLFLSSHGGVCDGQWAEPFRRIRCFCDPTPIDPSIEVMRAELDRRRQPPVVSNREHGGRQVTISFCDPKARVLSASAAGVHQRAHQRACPQNTETYVWVMNESTGEVTGYAARRLTLLP